MTPAAWAVLTAINVLCFVGCVWQASKASWSRRISSMSESGAMRYFEWARNEADRATGRQSDRATGRQR